MAADRGIWGYLKSFIGLTCPGSTFLGITNGAGELVLCSRILYVSSGVVSSSISVYADDIDARFADATSLVCFGGAGAARGCVSGSKGELIIVAWSGNLGGFFCKTFLFG
jgi:hypothetical protein